MAYHRVVRSLLAVGASAGLLFAAIGPAGAAGNPPFWAGRPLVATMTGAAEVPPADPDGTGTAEVWVNAGQKRVCWRIGVASITLPATAAHIHLGAAGVNGDVKVTLSPPDATGKSSGCTAVTRELARNLIRHPAQYYVNVHTTDFPGGAIRGQLARGRAGAPPAPVPQPTRTYQVTMTNLTTGQPLSSPLLVTHTGAVDVWTLGAFASDGLRQIAEDGNNAPLAATLGALAGVREVKATATPIQRSGVAGSSLTVNIKSKEAGDVLSIATMLICTNDGFTGLDSVVLPDDFAVHVLTTNAYDAGTETNDQLSVNLVDACGTLGPVALAADGNGRVATAALISAHPGVTPGVGALTAAHVWTNPVLQVTIQRLS